MNLRDPAPDVLDGEVLLAGHAHRPQDVSRNLHEVQRMAAIVGDLHKNRGISQFDNGPARTDGPAAAFGLELHYLKLMQVVFRGH